MTPESSDNVVVRRYLLGRLAPETRESVEERLFSDDQVFWERVCLEEEVLIDEYAAGRLDEETQADFERHFLSTDERRSKLDFIRTLRTHLEHRQGHRGWWDWLRVPAQVPRWALAVAATVLLALPAAVWQLAGVRPDGREINVWLSSQMVRAGGDLARVRIGAGCQLVRLRLDSGLADYPAFRATLHDVADVELWSQGQLTAATIDGRPAVTLTLPCELLAGGDYHVRLYGVSPGADPVVLHRYDVRVLRD